MVIEITPQTIVTAAAVMTSAFLLIQRFAKGVRWFDRQAQQSADIVDLQKRHKADVEALESEFSTQEKQTNIELQLLTYGVLACLRGLHEKGCNGPVTEAITKIERHLNENAHK